MPEPNSMMLLGSGTVPVVVVLVLVVVLSLPRTVKDSEGIVPTEFSEACRRTGVLIPVNRVAVGYAGVLQVQPVGAGAGKVRAAAAKVPFSLQTL